MLDAAPDPAPDPAPHPARAPAPQARPALRARPSPPLPVEALVQGKPQGEVAALLPRLFALCRAAQSRAVRLALDLPDAGGDAALRREILRDHALRLAVVLPGHFGQSAVQLPPGWQGGGAGLRRALFGPEGALPQRPEEVEAWLAAGDAPLAGLARRIDGLFGPGAADPGALPMVSEATALEPAAAVENSCAVRVAGAAPLAHVAATRGRGPLWRLMARACDLAALLDGAPLDARRPAPGTALVPATRGLYAVQARCAGGRVAAFARVTPTDHLQAPGGVLERSLAALPADRAALAPLLMDLLDPCTPIRLEAGDA